MTRRIILQQQFYACPTEDSLRELVRSVELALIEHTMPPHLARLVIEKAEEYYAEESKEEGYRK